MTYLAGQCHKHLMVGRNVYRTTVDGVEICIRQLGRVEEITWLPYDAGLSAAYESHSYSRRLPALFEFLHVDITRQSHGLFALAKPLLTIRPVYRSVRPGSRKETVQRFLEWDFYTRNAKPAASKHSKLSNGFFRCLMVRDFLAGCSKNFAHWAEHTRPQRWVASAVCPEGKGSRNCEITDFPCF